MQNLPGPLPTKSGQLITTDHMVMGPTDAGLECGAPSVGRSGPRRGLAFLFQLPDKTSESVVVAVQVLIGKTAVKLLYSDNAPKLMSAAQALGWNHEHATPGRPQTTGVAEHAVRSVLDGTRKLCSTPDSQKYSGLWLASTGVSRATHSRTRKALSLGTSAAATSSQVSTYPLVSSLTGFPSQATSDLPKLSFSPRATPGLCLGRRVFPGANSARSLCVLRWNRLTEPPMAVVWTSKPCV